MKTRIQWARRIARIMHRRPTRRRICGLLLTWPRECRNAMPSAISRAIFTVLNGLQVTRRNQVERKVSTNAIM
jgi:hypothetical protein